MPLALLREERKKRQAAEHRFKELGRHAELEREKQAFRIAIVALRADPKEIVAIAQRAN